MKNTPKAWYADWFNEDYLKLYKSRDDSEALKHVNFITTVCELQGDERILDVGCGMGRHSFIFAKRNFSVVGIDRSEKMIQKAHERAKKDKITNVQFICDDIRSAHSRALGLFNLAVSLFTSFGLEDKDEENQRFLIGISSVLKKNGLFFIDYLNPEYIKQTFLPLEKLNVDEEPVEIRREIKRDQIVKTIRISGKTYHEKIKLYTHEKLKQMLIEANFEIEMSWSDYDGALFSKTGKRQLIKCRKA